MAATRLVTIDSLDGHGRPALRSAPLYLVRHAEAGDRDTWTEDDRLRPLSDEGSRQAESLASSFQGLRVERIVSSPHVRCVQTVRPLAFDRGVPFETSEALAEGAAVGRSLDLLGWCLPGTVLCVHGDLVPVFLDHLESSGVQLDGERPYAKGSVWIVESAGTHAQARYVPPPSER